VRDLFVCPNCGKSVKIQSVTAPVICEHCGEKSLVSSGNRLVLAQPIRSYLRVDESEGEMQSRARFSTGVRPSVSAERKRRTARLARERIAQQKQLYQSGLLYGILAIILGGMLGILCRYRLESIQGDWIGWIGLGIGVVVLLIGFCMTLWFLRALGALRASQREIEQEVVSL